MSRQLNKYYRSFSGTDSLVFIILPNSTPVVLGSLSTVSYSLYRDKKPVPIIGQINVGGFTRGTRVYAGTMIFTMINEHWLNELTDQFRWIRCAGVQRVDELPLFDLMIVCANEYGATMQMMIYGVDLTEEGQVISVENMFTENTLSFVARDISYFDNSITEMNNQRVKSTWTPGVKRQQMAFDLGKSTYATELRQTHSFSSSRMLESDEVKEIQKLLNELGDPKRTLGLNHALEENGRFDRQTQEAILNVQSRLNLSMTGEVDDVTYQSLLDLKNQELLLPELTTAKIKSQESIPVKQSPSNQSLTLYHYLPEEEVVILEETEDELWFKTNKGYIPIYRTNHYKHQSNLIFQTIDRNCKDQALIGEIQQALITNDLAPIEVTGQYDAKTQYAVQCFQERTKLPVTRLIDEQTWHRLKEEGILDLSDEYVYEKREEVQLKERPTLYEVTVEEWLSQLDHYGLTYQTNHQEVDVKLSLYLTDQLGNVHSVYHQEKLLHDDSYELTLQCFEEFLRTTLENQSFKQIEFIVYLFKDIPYKWSFKFKSGGDC